jgi:uncharacterized protein with ATP-grasp and redox domains
MDWHEPPPAMAKRVHAVIRQVTGQNDPYAGVKGRCTQIALGLLPKLRQRVETSLDPFGTAVRFAIAGNAIDFAAQTLQDAEAAVYTIHNAHHAALNGDIEAFEEDLFAAESILYLADNAGEIVFDRLLLEQMPMERTTLVVRGAPVINDATMKDARAAGITALVEVIDNGSDAPGTILDDCSPTFLARFDDADLVVAKGQGNFETLSDVTKNIWFLLKVKCPVIAKPLHCEVGSMVIRKQAQLSDRMVHGTTDGREKEVVHSCREQRAHDAGINSVAAQAAHTQA